MTQPSNRGGYRKPETPAPVSGPGALSARTDGGPTQAPIYYPNTTYGQGGYLNQQSAAPMAGAAEVPQELPTVIGINENTNFPNEAISHGANWGPGPGLSSVVPQKPSLMSTVEKALQVDDTGLVEFLYNRLNN